MFWKDLSFRKLRTLTSLTSETRQQLANSNKNRCQSAGQDKQAGNSARVSVLQSGGQIPSEGESVLGLI